MANNERMVQMLRAAALDIAENAEEMVGKKRLSHLQLEIDFDLRHEDLPIDKPVIRLEREFSIERTEQILLDYKRELLR